MTFDFDKIQYKLTNHYPTSVPRPSLVLTGDFLSVISISMYSQEPVVSRTDPLFV